MDGYDEICLLMAHNSRLAFIADSLSGHSEMVSSVSTTGSISSRKIMAESCLSIHLVEHIRLRRLWLENGISSSTAASKTAWRFGALRKLCTLPTVQCNYEQKLQSRHQKLQGSNCELHNEHKEREDILPLCTPAPH